MPKIKTHRGVAKRVKVTKSGKVKRNQAWKRHLATAKSAKRKRQLRKSSMMPKPEERRMLRLLGLR